MTTSRNGAVTVREGILFWKITAPLQPRRKHNLLFLHSGVTDSTAWDGEVARLAAQGWTCVVTDRLGFGASEPSKEFLESNPRPILNFNEHWAAVLEAALPKDDQRVVVIGLSMGAFAALEFTIERPDLVRGLVMTAGGVRDFECPLPNEEIKLLDREDLLVQAKDLDGLVHWQAHYWGDGPLQPVGRANPQLRARLMVWTRDITAREIKGEGGEGGMVFTSKGPSRPVQELLSQICVPTAIAYASKVPGAVLQEFTAGHIVNLDDTEAYDSWLEKFLKPLEEC